MYNKHNAAATASSVGCTRRTCMLERSYATSTSRTSALPWPTTTAMSGQNAAPKEFNPLEFLSKQSNNLKAYVSCG